MKQGMLIAILLLLIALILIYQFRDHFDFSSNIDQPSTTLELPKLDKLEPLVENGLRQILLDLMFTKNFSTLDQKFELIAEKYDQGAISEESFSRMMWILALIDPELDTLFKGWTSTTQSWVFHFTYATRSNDMTFRWRENSFSYLVPEGNSCKFKQMLALAIQHLVKAR